MFVKQNSYKIINCNNIPGERSFGPIIANQTNNVYQNMNNNMGGMNYNIEVQNNQIITQVPVRTVLAHPEFNNQKITIQNVNNFHNNQNNYNQNYNNQIIINQPGVNIIKENNINDSKNSQKKKELIIKLNNFLNEENIQTKSLEKRSILNDPVFESIQKEEKKELIKVFNKGKFGFQNEILNYLNTQPIQFDQNLIFQIINYENGTQIYKNKMENRISKLRKDAKLFEINYLTILLLGKSGVGKTTLINKILNVNGKTGTGDFVTTATTPYQSKVMPYLRLVDTRGIEVSANFGAEQLRNEAFKFIGQQNQTNNYNNFVHCIWYCISSKRFEKVEVETLRSIQNYYQGNKIPIIIVFTQTVDVQAIKDMKKYISSQIDCKDFVEILAEDIQAVGGQVLKSFGLNNLINKTLIRCKEALNGDMRTVMTNLISYDIENYLKAENDILKNDIFEKLIINFAKKFNIQSVENFQQCLINLIGYNVNYFLNKKLEEQSISLIKNGNILRYHMINYINFYQQKVNSIIEQELSQLAFNLLDIQATKELEMNKPTLMQNKRKVKNFISDSNEFLNNNYYCMAQKFYIGKFIEVYSESLSKIFMDYFNSVIDKLLKKNEIKTLIDSCFLKKFQEFEERITSLNSQRFEGDNLSSSLNHRISEKHSKKKDIHKETTKNYSTSSSSKDQSSSLISSSNPLSDVPSVMTVPLYKKK